MGHEMIEVVLRPVEEDPTLEERYWLRIRDTLRLSAYPRVGDQIKWSDGFRVKVVRFVWRVTLPGQHEALPEVFVRVME